MPPHEDSCGVRVFLHRRCHAIRQIFLEWGIGNDRDAEGIQVRQGRAISADPNALDHLPNACQTRRIPSHESLTSYHQIIRRGDTLGSAIAILERPNLT